jgi:hypothetical protein
MPLWKITDKGPSLAEQIQIDQSPIHLSPFKESRKLLWKMAN